MLTGSCALMICMISKISRIIKGASPNDGSSSSRSFGLSMSARTDREHLLLAAGQRAGLLRATFAQAREIVVHTLEIRRSIAFGRASGRRPRGRFSSTVRLNKSRGRQAVRDAQAGDLFGGRASMRRPSNLISPAVFTSALTARVSWFFRAVGAEDRRDSAVDYIEADLFEHSRPAVERLEALDFQERAHLTASAPR